MRLFSLFVLLAASLFSQTVQIMPTPTPALGSLTIRGWRIYYADSILGEQQITGTTALEWTTSRATGVQFVVLFFNQTYRIWHPGSDKAHAGETTCDADTFFPDRDRSRRGHCAVLPYRHIFRGADWYWKERGDVWGAGLVTDIPAGLPVGGLKEGALISDDDFKRIRDVVQQDYIAP